MQKIRTAIILFTLCAGYVYGAPVIDGILDPSEGYTTGFYLDLNVERAGYADDRGQIWLYHDLESRDIYAALILPVTLVDNSYGDNSIGWVDDAASGRHHNFEDLINSDGAEFELFNNDGESVLHFEIDYFSENEGSYFSEIGGIGQGDDPENLGFVTAFATSLEYNFNTLDLILTEDSPEADSEYNVANPAQSDWVFDVVYEVKIDGDIFNCGEFGGMDIPLVHASPNKIGRNKVYPENTGEPIPEPMTLVLLALGGLITRRFNR
ncbi:MAG: hypothetical protein FVQ79_09900 [Planctomycetes bacterium]|nr:hypothetical protein [Planctomycetota bacterium]